MTPFGFIARRQAFLSRQRPELAPIPGPQQVLGSLWLIQKPVEPPRGR